MRLDIQKLQALAAAGLLLASSMAPQASAQAAAPQQTATPPAANSQSGNPPGGPKNSAGMQEGNFPNLPQPVLTTPFELRTSGHNFTIPKSHFPNPFAPYTAINVAPPEFGNTSELGQLVRDGKIYLSLSDAIELALSNNYDIAIQRYNLDIADTDILRAKAGAALRGVNAGVVQGTIGGATSTQLSGGGPGGTSVASGGSASGALGVVSSTNGGGPTPEYLDPVLTSTIQREDVMTQSLGVLSPASFTNTNEYNFGYTQGFTPGAQLAVTFDNSRATSNNPYNAYSPLLSSNFRATLTQHLLQGRGFFINKRFIYQAKRDRQITDSAFRQQVLSTVNQVENIYWGLVSAYEDVQAKQRALDQSKQLAADNRKQLEIGTLAPLDVTNADSSVATDQQSLVTSETTLEYQQLIMKQAIARNLNDPQLSAAPVIPTDRVGLDRLPEEDMPVEDLVREAYVNNPQIEQAVLNMKNNRITIKAEKNGLLPVVDAYAFYGGNGLGGAQNPDALNFDTGALYAPNYFPSIGYGSALENSFNNSSPNKGVGVNITLPFRNRAAQADQARSQMEYRQSEMQLQQLYTRIRIQVINGQYALTNDRAQVAAAQAARDYAVQSLDAEQKKYKLGASTTANVLQQGRLLAISENTLISDTAAYARDRAALLQLLSNTLDRYGISIEGAAAGTVTQAPVIPGLTAPTTPTAPKPISGTPAPAPSM